MRNLKRFLSLALTMLMVVGCFSFASSAQTFEDVYDYAEAIDVLSDLGVIKGYEDGSFGPDDAVTRWQMALLIAKLETGKTSEADHVATWKPEINYTAFTDVIADQYLGSIAYAYNEGIIVGTTATTFDPTAGITYQDALTMVVRALGYGSDAMNAGYPWKYINKANELNLAEGLASDIAYTDELTRGETAQILYNAFNAIGADKTTYARDVFNLQTVVIVADTTYRMTNTEKPSKKDYVAFSPLNADGTISSMTYYLPSTDFGEDVAVGASYKVTTANDFQSIGMVLPCPTSDDYIEDGLTEKDITTTAASNADNAYITIAGEKYKAVSKYTQLYNNQGIKGNTDEILVYTNRSTESTGSGTWKTDANGNILNEAGHIVAYYVPAITGSTVFPYAKYDSATGVYTPFYQLITVTAKDKVEENEVVSWDLVNNWYTLKNGSKYSFTAVSVNGAIKDAGGVWYADETEYEQWTAMYWAIKHNNAHATAIAYDDNFDGLYDRIFYTYQSFGYVNNTGDGKGYYVTVGNDKARIYDNNLAAYNGQYIRWDVDVLRNAQAKDGSVTVYESYPFATGLCTAVTANSKITIGGQQYDFGVANFNGANADYGWSIGTELVGKQVSYCLVDGKVVVVNNYANSTSQIVFDNFTGITTAGYASALAYVESNKASTIVIATIDGYSYQQYILKATNRSLTNTTDGIAPGTLFKGTKDALGFWHLETIEEATYYAPDLPDAAIDDMVGAVNEALNSILDPNNVVPDSIYVENLMTAAVYFKNGIANGAYSFYYKNGGVKAFSQFKTNASTIFVAYDKASGKFYTQTGVPADGSIITINNGGYMDVKFVDGIARFVYIHDGAFAGVFATSGWISNAYDSIVYIDKRAKASEVATNVTDDGTSSTLLGYTYTYDLALDMISGQRVKVQSGAIYNLRLEAGKFYAISNGYVEEIVDPYKMNAEIQEGLLYYVDTYNSIIKNKYDADSVSYSSSALVYKIVDGNVMRITDVTGNGNQQPYNYIDSYSGITTDYIPVYYYSGIASSSRVILIVDTKATELADLTKNTAVVSDTEYGAGYWSYEIKVSANSYNTLNALNQKFLASADHDTIDYFPIDTTNINIMDRWLVLYGPATFVPTSSFEYWAVTTFAQTEVVPGYGILTSAYGIELITNEALIAGTYQLKTMFDGAIYTITFVVPKA